MKRIKVFLENIGDRLIPKRLRPNLRNYLLKAGEKRTPYMEFGILFCLTFLAAFIAYLIFYFKFLNKPVINVIYYRFKLNLFVFLIITIIFLVLVEIIMSLLAVVLIKFYFDFRIYKRTRKIEEVLPDFLQSVSVNLKAGMTFDKALWNAVESEFSVLEKEIEIVAKKEMAGEDITNALRELADKYNSPILKESINILIFGIEEGGDITDIVEELVKNVKETTFLRKEAIASITNYIIFIAIIATVISPLLFAFSFNLLVILKSIASKITAYGASVSTSLPFFIDDLSIDPDNFIIFSRLCIIAISVASTFILVNLVKGNYKDGLKYIPILVFASLLVYEISMRLLVVMFKAMF
ncbi:type II secretion system F family protein [Candidatus Woesearchaeota archaeon]|nr:type II secretion system F family protein [Candidatus Woesearchaeota archaeon]